eukprot:454061_1
MIIGLSYSAPSSDACGTTKDRGSDLTSCLCSGVPSERLEYDNQGKILILLYPSIYLCALPCPPSKPFHFRPVDAEKIRTIIATTAADELIQGASGRRAK